MSIVSILPWVAKREAAVARLASQCAAIRAKRPATEELDCRDANPVVRRCA